jgi:hypothetical protein
MQKNGVEGWGEWLSTLTYKTRVAASIPCYRVVTI